MWWTTYTRNSSSGVASVSNPTAGSWSIDYSQLAPPVITFTDLIIRGPNTAASSSGNPFGPNHVGNLVYVNGAGTGFTVQRAGISSVAGGIATFEKSLGTVGSSGGTGYLGGPARTPGQVMSLALAGNWIFLKTGYYPVGVNTSNVASGKLAPPLTNNSTRREAWFCGYETVRGDYGSMPSIVAVAAATYTVLTMGSGNGVQLTLIENILVDGGGISGITGVGNGGGTLHKCKIQSCNVNGYTGASASSNIVSCEVTACTGVAISSVAGVRISNCYIHDNIGNGVQGTSNPITLENTVIANCIGGTADGFVTTTTQWNMVNCTIHGCGRYGINYAPPNAAVWTTIQNCIFTGNVNTAIFNSAVADATLIENCAFFGNGIDVGSNATRVHNKIKLIGLPYNNAAIGDYSLNTVSGQGSSCRSAGIGPPTQSSYIDIGGVQSLTQQSAATGSSNIAGPVMGSIIIRSRE